MPTVNIIRAWKDQAYRNSLTAQQRAELPPNPAGAIELRDPASEQGAGMIGIKFSPCRKCQSTSA